MCESGGICITLIVITPILRNGLVHTWMIPFLGFLANASDSYCIEIPASKQFYLDKTPHSAPYELGVHSLHVVEIFNIFFMVL